MSESKKFDIRIRVEVHEHRNPHGDVLSVEQVLTIQADTFLDLCRVLARFDELAKELNRQESDR